MKKKILLGGAVGVISFASIATANAHFGGNGTIHEAVRLAVSNKDYSAFQRSVKDTQLADKINSQEEFDHFAKARELRENGDREGAHKAMQELGFMRHHKIHDAVRGEVRSALEEKDYSAFQEAITDKEFGQKIDSREKFNRLIEAHMLRKDGDYDSAHKVMQELGFDGRNMHKNMHK